MHTQWYKYSINFIAALVAIMAGLFIAESLIAAQTNEQDDVQSTVVAGQLAPRLQNLGNHKFPVTTNSARAQLFINQGLMLAYGFNHAEAARSFREAARLDPNCAMAYWGMALVQGPNINMAMAPEAEQPAHEAIHEAKGWNKAYYGKPVNAVDILVKKNAANPNSEKLRASLAKVLQSVK